MLRSAKSLRNKTSGSSSHFRTLLDNPRVVQDALLRDILARNARCEYGLRHEFSLIGDYAEYSRRVPIVGYEDLRTFIERIANGEQAILMQDPVIVFEETGGSSGGRKLAPYTAASLESFQRGLLPWMDDLFSAYPAIVHGSAYWSVSPACRERRVTTGGFPLGLTSDAAYFGVDLAEAVLMSLSVPVAVGQIRDVELWRHITLFYLLADERLALISVWSPTFILELLRFAHANVATLAACIAEGRPFKGSSPSPDLVLPMLPPNPQRAQIISAALADQGYGYETIWPNLQVISCWDHASSRPYAAEVRKRFPRVLVQGKGLLATEGMSSLPLCDFPMPVLALESGVFEFVGSDGIARLADQVVVGGEYEILLTNDCGFYRYAIGDKVRISGFAGNTPMLEFIGRHDIESDLCGEKLHEEFVLCALQRLGLTFSMLVAQPESPACYALLVDGREVPQGHLGAIARKVDDALKINPQYLHARSMGQLGAPHVLRCINPLSSWMSMGMMSGQRMGDIKPPALCTRLDWRQHFMLE